MGKEADEMLKEQVIGEMKKGIKEHPILKQYLRNGIEKYGLSEEEALDCMIYAWLIGRKE